MIHQFIWFGINGQQYFSICTARSFLTAHGGMIFLIIPVFMITKMSTIAREIIIDTKYQIRPSFTTSNRIRLEEISRIVCKTPAMEYSFTSLIPLRKFSRRASIALKK